MTTPVLDLARLAELKGKLSGLWTLSIYVEVSGATAREGQRELDDAVSRSRKTIAAGDRSLAAFEPCVATASAAVDRLQAKRPTESYAVFVTASGVQCAALVPGDIATEVRWQRGMWASPYVHALAEVRPVVAVIADERSAHLYRLAGSDFIALRTILLDTVSDFGNVRERVSSASGHSPDDMAEAEQLVGTASGRDRIAQTVAHDLGTSLGYTEGILLGGLPNMVSAIVHALSPDLACRALIAPALTAEATESDIRAAAVRYGPALSDAADRAAVGSLRMRGGPHGSSVAGMVKSLNELRLHCVKALFLSPRFIEEHAIDTEEAIDLALDQKASVDVLSGKGASQLDILIGGIGALLSRPPAAAPCGPAHRDLPEHHALSHRETTTVVRLPPRGTTALVLV